MFYVYEEAILLCTTGVLLEVDMKGNQAMKVLLLVAVVLVLLALDWAAVHDILKGEPNLYGEYGMLAFSAIVFGLLALAGLRKRDRTRTVE
jgi:hypothetical protein